MSEEESNRVGGRERPRPNRAGLADLGKELGEGQQEVGLRRDNMGRNARYR